MKNQHKYSRQNNCPINIIIIISSIAFYWSCETRKTMVINTLSVDIKYFNLLRTFPCKISNNLACISANSACANTMFIRKSRHRYCKLADSASVKRKPSDTIYRDTCRIVNCLNMPFIFPWRTLVTHTRSAAVSSGWPFHLSTAFNPHVSDKDALAIKIHN